MKSGFYCTNLKQINSMRLVNLIFKHISPQMAQKYNKYSNICCYDFPLIFSFVSLASRVEAEMSLELPKWASEPSTGL